MKKKLYSEMTEYIEAMIASGVFAPNTKIPTLRELAQQFKLSVATARRGINWLCSKELLELKHGSGIYVASQNNSASKKSPSIAVHIFSIKLAENYCSLALTGVQMAAAKYNYQIVLSFSGYDFIDQGKLIPHDSNCKGLILLGCYDQYLDEIPRNTPCVGVEMHESYNGLISNVSMDPVNAAKTAVDFFMERKIKQLKVISHPFPIHQFRAECFINQWKKYGSYELLESRDAINISEFQADNTAYLFVSGDEYNLFADDYKRINESLPSDDSCVLSLDGKSLIMPGFYPVNTIGIDWRTSGEAAFEECLRRINNPGTASRRIYINNQLRLI